MAGTSGLCSLRVSRKEADEKISGRIGSGEGLLARLDKLREEVRREAGYEGKPSQKHERDHDTLWSDYRRWNDYNKELLQHLFDSRRIAAEYGARWEPEETFGCFLAEIEDSSNDLKARLESLRSIKERLPLFEEARRATCADGLSGLLPTLLP